MGARRRTRITIETDQVTIIRRRHFTRTWCPECGREAEAIAIEEALLLTGWAQPVPRDCAKTRGWHLVEATSGSQLICLDSLLKSM